MPLIGQRSLDASPRFYSPLFSVSFCNQPPAYSRREPHDVAQAGLEFVTLYSESLPRAYTTVGPYGLRLRWLLPASGSSSKILKLFLSRPYFISSTIHSTPFKKKADVFIFVRKYAFPPRPLGLEQRPQFFFSL